VSDLAASSVAVDLSRLEAPPVLRALSFEERLATIVADFQQRFPGYDTILESDPVMKLLEELAYRDLLGTAEVNDTARSLLLAYAIGADLDHLAARFNLARLVITPATDDTAAVLESDADLRRRVQLAPERFPMPGRTAGGYRAIALEAAPSVKDVALVKRDGGRVDVILLGRSSNGQVEEAVVGSVYRALQAEDAAQLTDIISVASAAIVPYSPIVTVRIRSGPDPQLVRAAAETALRAYAADRHRIGMPVYAQMLAAAAAVGDVAIGPREAAWLQDLIVNVEVVA
jgi:phage-related baseplate assembly protein